MTNTATLLGRWTAVRDLLHERRAARAERASLARAFGSYDSPADRAELAAIFDRYEGDDTDALRDLVDWTKAA